MTEDVVLPATLPAVSGDDPLPDVDADHLLVETEQVAHLAGVHDGWHVGVPKLVAVGRYGLGFFTHAVMFAPIVRGSTISSPGIDEVRVARTDPALRFVDDEPPVDVVFGDGRLAVEDYGEMGATDRHQVVATGSLL